MFLALGLVLALVTAAHAATGQEYFQEANQAYEAGDFGRALLYYDSAATSVRSPSLFYNRGNAQFKLGSIGRAVADYNRAYILDPSDADIRQNLEFIRAYRPDKMLAIPNPIVQFLTSLLRLPDLGTAKLANGLLFLFALLVLALGLVLRLRPVYWIAIGLGVLWLYSTASWVSWAAEASPDKAVVVVPELTLRSGPGEEYKDIVIVHDGLEVAIRSRRGQYVLVQAPGGEGGWAEESSFEQVFPAE